MSRVFETVPRYRGSIADPKTQKIVLDASLMPRLRSPTLLIGKKTRRLFRSGESFNACISRFRLNEGHSIKGIF